MIHKLTTIIWMCIMLTSFAGTAQTKLLRFPDIYGEEVVFCYAGDIWKAPVGGGTGIRLTAHPGQELFPKFSPDGNFIAFTFFVLGVDTFLDTFLPRS